MEQQLYETVLIDGVIHYKKYEPETLTTETPVSNNEQLLDLENE